MLAMFQLHAMRVNVRIAEDDTANATEAVDTDLNRLVSMLSTPWLIDRASYLP